MRKVTESEKKLQNETPDQTRRRYKLESSWGRIIQHVESSSTFAVISAYIAEFSEGSNIERHNQLRKDIRSMGYGYIEMDSGYTYQDTGVTMEEMSFFIPEITRRQALELGRKYDQESIIFKDAKQFAILMSDTGAVDMEFEIERGRNGQITFDPETLKIAFSKLKKANKNQRKPFAFRAKESIGDYGSNFVVRAYAIPTRSEVYRAQKEKVFPKAEPISLNQYVKETDFERSRKGSKHKQERKRIGTVAFWAKGDEVIENDEAHVRVVMENPEKFGLSKEEIEELYATYGEKYGVEGKARNEVIKMVARNGWVRVRHYVNKGSDYWSIQVDRYRRRKESIDYFIWWAIGNEIMGMNDELVITGYDDNLVLQYGFMDGGVKAYLEEEDHSKHARSLFETLADDQIIQELVEAHADTMEEAEYNGKKVTLDKPMKSDKDGKKYMVYVKDGDKVKKVYFGDPNMEIRRDNAERRKSFRSRHRCDSDPPEKTTPRYWACQLWRADKSVTDIVKGN